jgi:hypothetical protein
MKPFLVAVAFLAFLICAASALAKDRLTPTERRDLAAGERDLERMRAVASHCYPAWHLQQRYWGRR